MKDLHKIYFLLAITTLLLSCRNTNENMSEEVILHNPVIPGYFADPSIVEHENKFYMYATADPWGTDFLTCWISENFQDWTFHKLNWPTKEACTSPLSQGAMVWAPSVVKKKDAFYMYISVGSEIWCGKAAHPLGPWENILGSEPMISFDKSKYYHVIDAEAFIDDDGRAYLYWGSGLNWTNGHCFAAELNDDMCTFKTEPVEVTPSNYFEGPFMIKHDSLYYLTYSEGITMDDSYEVRYAVGNNPFGPFIEADNSPVLRTNDSLKVYGPGHHTIMPFNGKNYIVYHRHSLPFISGTALRQICINEIQFDTDNRQIKNILPEPIQQFPALVKSTKEYIYPQDISASSAKTEYTIIQNALDNNFSTLWRASDTDENPYIILSFENDTFIPDMEIRFEYPWETYYIKTETSLDNEEWITCMDYSKEGVSGSPVVIALNKEISYLKISFDTSQQGAAPAIWDLYFY